MHRSVPGSQKRANTTFVVRSLSEGVMAREHSAYFTSALRLD
jgi:hypothetical protein